MKNRNTSDRSRRKTAADTRSGFPQASESRLYPQLAAVFERSFSVAASYEILVRNQQKLPGETPTEVREQRLQRNYSFAEDLKGEEPLKIWQVCTNFRRCFHA